MSRAYRKSTRTQYPKFLGPPHDAEFGFFGPNTGISRNQALSLVPQNDLPGVPPLCAETRYPTRKLNLPEHAPTERASKGTLA